MGDCAVAASIAAISSYTFRLLTFIRDCGDDDLCFKLESYDLKSKSLPAYAALSYTWEEKKPLRPARCGNKELQINEDLHLLLKELQQINRRTHIWVDQICIDQTDKEDLNRQIPLIYDIFRGAHEVIVPLGRERRSLHPADPERLRFVQKTFAEPEQSRGWYEREAAAYHQLRLLSHPYWSRVWTLQELVPSPLITLILPDAELSWNEFWENSFSALGGPEVAHHNPSTKAAYNIYSLGCMWGEIILTTHLIKLDSSYLGSLESLSLSWLDKALDVTKRSHAQDPRDKIFALHSMATMFGVRLPQPNYLASTADVIGKARDMIHPNVCPPSWSQTSVDLLDSERPLLHGEKDASGITFLHQLLLQALRGWTENEVPPKTHGFALYPSEVHSAQGGSSFAVTDCFDDERTMADYATLRWYLTKAVEKHKKSLLTRTIIRIKGLLSNCRADDAEAQVVKLEPVDAHAPIGHGQGSDNQRSTYSEQAKTSSKTKSQPQKRIRVPEKDDADDADELDRARKQVKQDSQHAKKNFACPYGQRNSQNPRLRGACRAPGFPEISRLKEHLYRAHQVHPCPRCGEAFPTLSNLSEHLLAAQICAIVIGWRDHFDRDQGFDQTQRDSIKGAKGEGAWIRIYKILFPDDPEEFYPPPYQCDPQFMQFVDRFCSYYQQQTAQLIPQRLEDAELMTSLSTSDIGTFRASVTNFVTDMHHSIVQSFRSTVLAESPVQARVNPQTMFLDYLDDLEAQINSDGTPGDMFPDTEYDWPGLFVGMSSGSDQQNAGGPALLSGFEHIRTQGDLSLPDDGQCNSARGIMTITGDEEWSLVNRTLDTTE